ncbi:MAG: YicC family protein [bacterium]|nr:YicC family protein [bacterium]
MYSMTGFGRAEVSSPVGSLTVEVSSVNNRFLEMSVRIPRQLSLLEMQIRELISSRVNRGQINLSVTLDDTDALVQRTLINKRLAAAYTKQLRALGKELKMEGDVSLEELVLIPDILKPDKERVDHEQVWKLVEKALTKALTDLIAMRKKEGQAMATDMQKRLVAMKKAIGEIEKRSTGATVIYREKLQQRIASLLESGQAEQLRLEEEIALFAERTDITEECTRLKSHIDLYQQALKMKEPAGKRLNFILQEMNREANTIGSKCSEFAISSLAISLKEEIEKLRELVQNVE